MTEVLCPVCGEKFGSCAEMNRHMPKKHPFQFSLVDAFLGGKLSERYRKEGLI